MRLDGIDRIVRSLAAALYAALCAKTTASSSELLANLFAPCTPVHETSPYAYRLLMLVLPFKSTRIPPHL